MQMKKYKLGEIVEINSSSIKSSDKIDEILYLDTANITENIIGKLQRFDLEKAPSRAQRKVKNNTIIFSTVRPNQNHFGIMKNPAANLIVSSGFATLDIKNPNEFNADYLYYNLTQPFIVSYLQTVAQNQVSSYPSINPSDLANLNLSFPPFSEQQKIASVLSNIDKKISLNRQINRTLEQLAKRLYDYWFVQFDFPNENGKPYKSSGGKMVYNTELKREIPEGWKVGNLYEIADYINGLACQNFRPKEDEESLPVIKIREMHEGITKDTEQVSINIPEKYKINNGDILFSWSATLEVMIWNGGKGGLNQHIFKVMPKSYFSNEYVYQQLDRYIVNFQKQAEARKTTMGHITSEHINQSRVVLPSEEIVQAFTQNVKPLSKMQSNLKVENLRLATLRDKLLPLLMNGQLEII
ncbi:MAG: restriction endonuclease subunit S [Treponema sp.]|nr:restriction endonuclease subunit S [Treponema sp.]